LKWLLRGGLAWSDSFFLRAQGDGVGVQILLLFVEKDTWPVTQFCIHSQSLATLSHT